MGKNFQRRIVPSSSRKEIPPHLVAELHSLNSNINNSTNENDVRGDKNNDKIAEERELPPKRESKLLLPERGEALCQGEEDLHIMGLVLPADLMNAKAFKESKNYSGRKMKVKEAKKSDKILTPTERDESEQKPTNISSLGANGDGNNLNENTHENRSRKNKAKAGTHNKKEVSKCESDGIDFKQYVMPGQHTDKVVHADEMKATTSERELKLKKNPKRVALAFERTSPDQPRSLQSYENQESGVKSPQLVRRTTVASVPGNRTPVLNKRNNNHVSSLNQHLLACRKASLKAPVKSRTFHNVKRAC